MGADPRPLHLEQAPRGVQVTPALVGLLTLALVIASATTLATLVLSPLEWWQ